MFKLAHSLSVAFGVLVACAQNACGIDAACDCHLGFLSGANANAGAQAPQTGRRPARKISRGQPAGAACAAAEISAIAAVPPICAKMDCPAFPESGKLCSPPLRAPSPAAGLDMSRPIRAPSRA